MFLIFGQLLIYETNWRLRFGIRGNKCFRAWRILKQVAHEWLRCFATYNNLSGLFRLYVLIIGSFLLCKFFLMRILNWRIISNLITWHDFNQNYFHLHNSYMLQTNKFLVTYYWLLVCIIIKFIFLTVTALLKNSSDFHLFTPLKSEGLFFF